MTTLEMVNYAHGTMMHYQMEMNEHAMSEDAESSIRKQLNNLWDYMFPLTDEYAENAKDTLQKVKERHGFD